MFKGFVLSSSPIKERDLHLDIFTHEKGRQSLFLNGRKFSTETQLFCQYKLSWVENTPSISWFEAESDYLLKQQTLYCGHYLNELLARLLPPKEPQAAVYSCYEQCLIALSEGQAAQPWLRLFEARLLQELGYGFAWNKNNQQQDVCVNSYYIFEPKEGFKPANKNTQGAFLGESLLRWYKGENIKNTDWLMAKKVLGSMIDSLLDKPLISRELITKSMENSSDKSALR